MTSRSPLTTDQIQTIFNEEISAHGGTLRDLFVNGAQLFARSVLPTLSEILPGDRVHGGVAIRATDDQIAVHPYTFRLVCSNGAIMAHAIETRVIEISDFSPAAQIECDVREAIQLCCSPEAFSSASNQMRSAAGAEIDMMLTIAPMLSRMPAEARQRFMVSLLGRMSAGRRSTRYELMNVITASARETRNPEAKWRLEELGGAIAAGIMPGPHTRSLINRPARALAMVD